MKRRDFIKNTIAGGVVLSASNDLWSMPLNNPSPNAYDLVAVKNGEPAAMFDKAIQTLGGMSVFVKKGQTVVVKPNIGWDLAPERAACTNPELVKRIVQQCVTAGAKAVYVFDNTCDTWTNCYKTSGIEKAVTEAGGQMIPGNTETYYQSVMLPSGVKLKDAKVHEKIINSDVFINVPILKHHSSADITAALKNLMGIVWNRRFWHLNNLHQCIADFGTYAKKPTLNVIDAYRVLMKNGPKGTSVADVKLFKSLIVSKDIVAADAAAAKLFGYEPDAVGYIKIAGDMKIGVKDLTKLSIARIDM